jgi:hypothetical protein
VSRQADARGTLGAGAEIAFESGSTERERIHKRLIAVTTSLLIWLVSVDSGGAWRLAGVAAVGGVWIFVTVRLLLYWTRLPPRGRRRSAESCRGGGAGAEGS